MPASLRSFDPSIIDAATGNNALHELLTGLFPPDATSWVYELAEMLIQHGVDIHQHNKEGLTVAMSHAKAIGSIQASACVFHLMLQYGADINAQDLKGDTMLHHLIRNKVLLSLRDLYTVDVGPLDYFVINKAGQTPADLAAIMHAQQPDDDNRGKIHRIISAQVEMWRSRMRPEILQEFNQLLIPDLASMVIGYVDGSGKSFAAAPEPAAAAEDHE